MSLAQRLAKLESELARVKARVGSDEKTAKQAVTPNGAKPEGRSAISEIVIEKLRCRTK
jgi:hypothetical protein